MPLLLAGGSTRRVQRLGSPAKNNRDQVASERSEKQRPRELPASCSSERRRERGFRVWSCDSLSSPSLECFPRRPDQNTPRPPQSAHPTCALRFAPRACRPRASRGLAGERLLEMPPAAAALLRCAPAVPFAARSSAVSRSGMARRLVAASAAAGRLAPAYRGLLLDAGGTLLQVARPVAETYASIGRRYGTLPTRRIHHLVLSSMSGALHFVKRLACGLVMFLTLVAVQV